MVYLLTGPTLLGIPGRETETPARPQTEVIAQVNTDLHKEKK